MKLLAATSFLMAAAVGGANANVNANANVSRVLLNEDNCLVPEVNVDYPGNDITNAPAVDAAACCRLCADILSCGAYTWSPYQGGWCWYKGKRSTSRWTAPTTDGKPNVVSAEIYRCPALRKDTDLEAGYLFGEFQADRPESCCQSCVTYRDCKGFAWSTYNGGTCWLKGGNDLRPVYKPGVQASYFNGA